MMQIPPVKPQQVYQPAMQPSYNAVKIDIHNPMVNAPGACQAPQPYEAPAPIYGVPTASVYDVPQQSVYAPQVAQEQSVVPQPVVVPPTVVQTPPAAPVEAPAQTVDVKAPEAVAPQVDLNAFLAKLSSENYDEQANAMESIAELAQNSPQKATELLDVKVIDTLLGLMSKDSSKLAGPTPKQLEIREKIMNKQPVTEPETAEANQITPMEQVERNKQYALYTTAILQKLFASEVQKMSNTVVPLTELPGAAGIVEQVKNNANPMVRASAIDALSYVQCPEYKQDLTTLFIK